MTELSLARSEARDVLAAVVARVAHDADLDVLLIKGPSLSTYGLRDERVWTDVDVLVRPEHVGQLRRALAASGWEAVNDPSVYPLIRIPHAITFMHPRWHTPIDAHIFLPGCYADPVTVFEKLWTTRASIQLAHQPVPATGRIGSALVAALNLARTPTASRTRDETRKWGAAVAGWPEAERDTLATLAASCGAADVLSSLFDLTGVAAVGRGTLTQEQWDDWHDRIGQESRRGYAWMAAIRRAPPWAKPKMAFRALTFDPVAGHRGAPQPHGWSRLRLAGRRLGLAASVLLWRRS